MTHGAGTDRPRGPPPMRALLSRATTHLSLDAPNGGAVGRGAVPLRRDHPGAAGSGMAALDRHGAAPLAMTPATCGAGQGFRQVGSGRP